MKNTTNATEYLFPWLSPRSVSMPAIRALDIYRNLAQAAISSRSSGAYVHPIDQGDGVECSEDGQQSAVDSTHECLFISSTIVQHSICLHSAVLYCGLHRFHGFS